MDALLIEQFPVGRKSLRLAVVTETYPPEVNGVALSLARFVEGLRKQDHDIQLIRPRQLPAERPSHREGFSEMLTNGVPIPRYPDLKLGLPAKSALVKQWSLRRPDLVHIVTEGPLGWSALHAALKLKIPVCSDFRTNFHNYSLHYGIGWLKKPIVAYLRKFHNRTLMTMVPTEQMRAELGACGFRNLRVVERGVDRQLFDPARRSDALREAWGADRDTLVLLHVGRLAAEKNLQTLVESYRSIRSKQPGAKLVLVGDGPEMKALRSQVPDAFFTGTRRGTDLAVHYASADLFLFPSLTETFGNVTLEALASGLPIVAFDYAAASRYVRQDSNGRLARYGDDADFIQQASELVADLGPEKERLKAMGRQARISTDSLDWNCVIQRLEATLLSVV